MISFHSVIISCLTLWTSALSHDIFLITMGGSKSHKLPFVELAHGLVARGHDVTLYSVFPEESPAPFKEIIPLKLMYYINNFTNWDIVGPRLLGKEPVSLLDAFQFGYTVCQEALDDSVTLSMLSRHADLLIIDGAYPECAAGLAYHFGVPFILLNTVGFYTGSMSMAGNPAPYSVTPYFGLPHSDDMNLWQRALNAFWNGGISIGHWVMTYGFIDPIIKAHLGAHTPPAYQVLKNASFILQNGHFTVSYPRPYLPGVAEVACLHCKAPTSLPKDLEDFVSGGLGNGFIYVSMGSSVRAINMPQHLREMMVKVFSELPYQVLWKWEAEPETMPGLSKNIRLGKWFPQQDLLGHPKIRVFVSHGGLLSMFESVYHAVPIVSMPVFFDHECNSHKAEKDGYALKLHFKGITHEKLSTAIKTVIEDPKYKKNAQIRSALLHDQPEPPLDRAIYWIEYVLRHKGAYHLQSPAKDLNFFQYYMIDVSFLLIITLILLFKATKVLFTIIKKKLFWSCPSSVSKKNN